MNNLYLYIIKFLKYYFLVIMINNGNFWGLVIFEFIGTFIFFFFDGYFARGELVNKNY